MQFGRCSGGSRSDGALPCLSAIERIERRDRTTSDIEIRVAVSAVKLQLGRLVPTKRRARARLNATMMYSVRPQSRLKRRQSCAAEDIGQIRKEEPCPPAIKRMCTVRAAAILPFSMR